MASSGWQSEQTLYTYSSNVRFIGNINVSSIVHSGTKLTINGTIAVGARGTSGYYASYNYGVQAIPTGGNAVKVVGNGQQLKVGGSDYHVSFSATVTTTAAATSYSFPVRFKACSNDSCSSSYWDVTKNWTLSFDKSYDIPSNFTVANLIPEWNAVTGTYTVGNWGGDPWQYFATRVLGSNTDESKRTENQFLNTSATTQTTTVTTRITNDSIKLEGGVKIYGCGQYWSDIYAMNTAGETNSSNVMFYTAPAPVSVTYTDQTNTGSRTYPVKVTGDLVNNHTTYDAANLTRYVRYQVDGGAWQVVENNSVKTLDAVTSFNITVPAGKTAVIESYMTYHGVQSEVNVTTITNGAKPASLYGSVNGRAKDLRPVYAAYGNYFSQQGPKLTSSNSTMAVSAESIRVTNVKSTASGYIFNGFAIPGTDELIGKKVTMNVEFKTSGSFTSGARLWWLNTAGTGIVSGPVGGIEVINNSGSYSVSGTIPTRPSGAGNLAVLLYANIASQNQGVYTDFTKVELKPDVSNLLNITKTHINAGIASTFTDGALKSAGTATSQWPSLTGKIASQFVVPANTPIVYSTSVETPAEYKLYSRFYHDDMSTYSGQTMSQNSSAMVQRVNYPVHGYELYFNTSSGAAIDYTANIKMEVGMNPDTLAKPNLIDTSAIGSGTTAGVSYYTAKDGTVFIKGTSTAAGHVSMAFKIPSDLLDKNVSMYYEGNFSNLSNMALKKNTSTIQNIGELYASTIGRTFKATSSTISDATRFDIYFASGKEIDAEIRFFVKEGSLATPFTPAVETKAHRLRKIYASINGATKLIYTE